MRPTIVGNSEIIWLRLFLITSIKPLPHFLPPGTCVASFLKGGGVRIQISTSKKKKFFLDLYFLRNYVTRWNFKCFIKLFVLLKLVDYHQSWVFGFFFSISRKGVGVLCTRIFWVQFSQGNWTRKWVKLVYNKGMPTKLSAFAGGWGGWVGTTPSYIRSIHA